MATILSRGPYSASVIIDGAAVPLYKVTTNEATKTTEAYIESTPGKAFELQYAISAAGYPFAQTSYRTHLDGAHIGGKLISPGNTRQCKGKSVGADEVQPFVFAKLETTDNDEEATTSESVMKGLGTVRVTLHEVLSGKSSTGKSRQVATTTSAKIHEKAPKKKLMSEMTKLGEPVRGAKHAWTKPKYIDPKDRPYWTFLFIYRSRVLLELIPGIGLPVLPVAHEPEGTPDHSVSPEPVPKEDKKPLVKRPHETVVISDDDEADVKPRLKMPRKSDGPIELVVID